MKIESSIFYISCGGSGATTWLAKMLSRHPKVVCFRSTRTFPPYQPYTFHRQEISPDDFMEGLMECGRATRGEKIFGSIHGYHGLNAKEACEKRGGSFSYIIRHPVERVHSAHISYLDSYYKNFSKDPIQNKDIHDRVCDDLLTNADLTKLARVSSSQFDQTFLKLRKSFKTSAKRVLPEVAVKVLSQVKWYSWKAVTTMKDKAVRYVPEKNYAGRLFVSMTKDFLSQDRELFEGCTEKRGIKMEEMVKSHEYFKNHLWPLVAPETEITDAYVNSILSEKRHGIHREVVLSPKEIWASWPQGMKDVFMKYYEFYNIGQICKAFDYDVSFL